MDTGLVLRAQQGDERAFEGLAESVAERLHAVAYRILRDPDAAEDATQQALLTIWRKLPTLRDPDRFEAWAYRTLVHICYAEARKASRWHSRLVRWPEREPTGGDSLTGVEERDRFDRVFKHLSVEHRTVIVLHYYVGMTHDEIGAAIGIPPGTVKSRLGRALKRIRALVGTDAPATSGSAKELPR